MVTGRVDYLLLRYVVFADNIRCPFFAACARQSFDTFQLLFYGGLS